jgi:hypothetical protein
MFASRSGALFVAIALCACTTASKRAEPPPPYDVVGSIGLVVTPDVIALGVRMPDDETAVGFDAQAEAKRKEAQKGVGVTAFTILVAPLAILAPLYPPAIQLAALPFMAANTTANLSQEVDRLKAKAEQTRRDAACAMRLSTAHPEVPDAFQRALGDPSLQREIRSELRAAIAARAGLPVAVLESQDEEALLPDAELRAAKERALPTLVALRIESLDLSAEAGGNEAATCRYKLIVNAQLNWWDVDRHFIVARSDALGNARLPMEGFDLPALLDRRDELRAQIAKGFRDAAGTFDMAPLRFSAAKSAP